LILLLFVLNQEIDFNDLYYKATTLLVQFQTEQESAFTRLVALGQDSAYAETTIAFLVSNFDTKRAREAVRMKDIFKQIGEPAISGIVEKIDYRGEDENARHLKQSIYVLGEIGGEKIVEPVARFIDDEQWQVRSGAYTALGKSGSRKAFPHILNGLEDTVDMVRKSAYYALSEICTESDTAYLIKALDDEFFGVRYGAVKGLFKIGTKAIPALMNQLGKNDMKDYYIMKVLSRIAPADTEFFDKAVRVKPEARLLIYEACEDQAVINRIAEHEDNVFLQKYLEKKAIKED
jgi:HEAT repeat protein